MSGSIMPEGNSSQSGFGRCLIEADPQTNSRHRGARRRALLASVTLEAAALAALLAYPLVATGERLGIRWVVPIPPYGGQPDSAPQRAAPQRELNAASPQDHRGPILQMPVPNALQDSTQTTGSSTAGNAGMGTGLPQIPGGGLGLVPIPPDSNHAWIPPAPQVHPAPPRQGPIRQSEGVQRALLVRRVEPVYPALAIQARQEGIVRLHAIIGRDGRIESLEVLSGPPLLVRAAQEAVLQWRYRPTLLNNQPVEVETFITVVFRLDR